MRTRIKKKKKKDSPQPSVEEIRQQFSDAGMPTDEWKDRPEGKLGVPPILQQSKETLEKVRDHLKQQIEADQRAVAAACEELKRLEHGGAAAGGR